MEQPDLLAWLGTKGLPSYTVVGRAVEFRALFRICIRETLYTGGMDEHAKNVSFDYIHGTSNSTSDEAKLSPFCVPEASGLARTYLRSGGRWGLRGSNCWTITYRTRRWKAGNFANRF